MRLNKFAAAAMLGISVLGLSACATGFPAQVSRYQAMPAPQGQSFIVVPMDARHSGGLEFSRYASMVAQGMQAQGYVPAASINSATATPRAAPPTWSTTARSATASSASSFRSERRMSSLGCAGTRRRATACPTRP